SFCVVLGLLRGHLSLLGSGLPAVWTGLDSAKSICAFLERPTRVFYSGRKQWAFEGRIEARSLRFEYDRKVIFKDLSFRLEPGQLTSIASPNGGGKTTLVRLILGLLYPTSGDLYADGRPYSEADI